MISLYGLIHSCEPAGRVTVLSLPLTNAIAKIRAHGVVDEPEDLDHPVWAGVVPIETSFGPAEPDPDLTDSTLQPPPWAPGPTWPS